MSAYIVDREHVRYLVNAALHHYSRSPGCEGSGMGPLYWYHNGESHAAGDQDRKAAAIGQILWDMNIKSVAARYPDDTIPDLPGTIGESYDYSHHVPAGGRDNFSAAWVLKACDGYEYQACETEDWDASEAAAIIRAIRHRAIQTMPDYDDAPTWHVTAEEVPVEA